MTASPLKFLAMMGACLLLASCAQTGPPLPPSLELPKPPTDLRASRKGNRVTLNWSEPALTTDRRSVRYLGPTLVCRGLEPEITNCENFAAMLPPPSARPQKSPQSALQSYIDTLPSDMLQDNPASELTYAVQVLNRNA